MKRPRLSPRRRRIAWLVLPPALWALVLALIPTGWAKEALIARLTRATGRSVRLESLQLGLCGGVRLHNLEIGEPGSAATPWLHVTDLRMNLHLLQLAFGQFEPTSIQANGLTVRIHRHPDGSFEFRDLIHPRHRPSADRGGGPTKPAGEGRATDDPPAREPRRVEFLVGDGRLIVIDEASGTRVDLTGVGGRGTWERHRVAIQELHGQLNGGRLDLAAQVDRAPEATMFEGQVRTEGVALDAGMGALGYLLPVLAGSSATLEGRLDLNLYLRGQGASADQILRSLVGHGNMTIDPIRLDGSRIVAELAALVALPERERIGSIRSQFAISRGRVASDPLTLNIAQVPITLAGWTDFDGRLDYRVRNEGLTARLSKEARGVLSDLPIDLDDLMAVRLQGTLQSLDVTIDGVPLGGRPEADPSNQVDDRTRLRQFGRRLREKIFR